MFTIEIVGNRSTILFACISDRQRSTGLAFRSGNVSKNRPLQCSYFTEWRAIIKHDCAKRTLAEEDETDRWFLRKNSSALLIELSTFHELPKNLIYTIVGMFETRVWVLLQLCCAMSEMAELTETWREKRAFKRDSIFFTLVLLRTRIGRKLVKKKKRNRAGKLI